MNVLISAPSSSAPAAPERYPAITAELRPEPAVATAGRGVLDGAFAVLDALAHADQGLGLTSLARVSGLAKSSTHRLAEHLVRLGAVQCFEHRYHVGPRMLRIGQRGSRIRCYASQPRCRFTPLPCNRAPSRRCGSCMNSGSDISVLQRPTATPTCLTSATPNRLPAPPPDASSTGPSPPATSRFPTAGPHVNGATFASPSAIRTRQWSTIRTWLPASVAYQRPCGGRMGTAPAQSPSRSTQTTSPSAYPPWCRTPRAASAPPFRN